MIKKELKIFYTALMYLTRIPVPKTVTHDPVLLLQSRKYFPLVGWIVAVGSSIVFLLFNRYTSADIGILASMIAGIFITGAFHEDGLADTCDAFGGGWTKEKILSIMKDSRIGTYAAIGLLCVLGAKFLLLRDLPEYTPNLEHPTSNIFKNYQFFLVILWAAHSLSRLMPVFVIQFSTYVTNPENSKSQVFTNKKLSLLGCLAALFFGLFPFLFLSWQYLLAIIPVVYATYELARYFRKWIGGYTGDCLGAVQQISEIVFYLFILIIWRYVA